jgi:hypothetical protein
VALNKYIPLVKGYQADSGLLLSAYHNLGLAAPSKLKGNLSAVTAYVEKAGIDINEALTLREKTDLNWSAGKPRSKPDHRPFPDNPGRFTYQVLLQLPQLPEVQLPPLL